mgnify:CR=1 FL=1
MNIRTKLTSLLSGLLLLVVIVSTLAGRIMMARRVDDNMRKEAEATAQDLALNLEDYLKRERSDEEVKAKLEEWRGRRDAQQQRRREHDLRRVVPLPPSQRPGHRAHGSEDPGLPTLGAQPSLQRDWIRPRAAREQLGGQ